MIKLFKDPFFNILDEFAAIDHLGPKTKINKTDDSYLIMIAVPGLTKDHLKIMTKEGVLKISFDGDQKSETNHFVPIFNKSYDIPDDVNEKEISGKVENGLLTINLPISKKKTLERLISLN